MTVSIRRAVPIGLAVAVTAVSFAAIFFRKAAPTHPLVAAAFRLAIASALLLPFVLRSRAAGRLTPQLLRAGVIAGCFYGVHFGTWVTSLTLTSVASSVTLVTATPILLGAWALLTGRDRPTPRHWLAMGLGVVGVLIIGSVEDGGEALLGDALALTGAAAMAGYLLIGRRLGEHMQALAFTGIAAGVGAVTLVLAALAFGVPLEAASAASLGWIALAALVPQLIGHTLLTWALRHTRPAVVGMATVGEPVGSTVLAYLWLGELVGPQVVLGCAVTLTAVIVALWEPRRRG